MGCVLNTRWHSAGTEESGSLGQKSRVDILGSKIILQQSVLSTAKDMKVQIASLCLCPLRRNTLFLLWSVDQAQLEQWAAFTPHWWLRTKYLCTGYVLELKFYINKNEHFSHMHYTPLNFLMKVHVKRKVLEAARSDFASTLEQSACVCLCPGENLQQYLFTSFLKVRVAQIYIIVTVVTLQICYNLKNYLHINNIYIFFIDVAFVRHFRHTRCHIVTV